MKFIRCNPNIIDIDLSENPLPESELLSFYQHMKMNQFIRNVKLDGISRLQNSTKAAIVRESAKNYQIYEFIELPNQNADKQDNTSSRTQSAMGRSVYNSLHLQRLAIRDFKFVTKYASLN